MNKTFILNDESRVNNHGFIVLNSGGKFDRFRTNPVMLNNHEPDELIGRWENLRIEGTQLLADAVFDEGDDDAKKIQGKVDRGFLKGASMGIQIDSAELRSVPGLDLIPVITSWELLEGSTASVPSNALCLKLYLPTGELLNSADQIKLSINNLINKNEPDLTMEKIKLTAEAAVVLNIGTEPEATALNAAIMELSARCVKAEKDLSAHMEAQATALVELAITEGRLTADKKDSFMKLAKTDFNQAKDLISAMPKKESLSARIKPGTATKDREDWNYMKWAKEDPKGLAKMSIEDPEGFKALKEKYSSK